jgi:hypothetical protein
MEVAPPPRRMAALGQKVQPLKPAFCPALLIDLFSINTFAYT